MTAAAPATAAATAAATSRTRPARYFCLLCHSDACACDECPCGGGGDCGDCGCDRAEGRDGGGSP
jgi:hypothetical protein